MVGFGSDLNKSSGEEDSAVEKWSSMEEVEQHFGQLDDEEIRKIIAEREHSSSVPLEEVAKAFGIDLNALIIDLEPVKPTRVAGFALPDTE